MRIAAVFHKSERLRHIGHLDLMRAMHRALRRSGLPVAYSKGFNPHINVSFASALSVGSVGLNEVMDVSMDAEVTVEHFLQCMNQALPPELQLKSARILDDKHPAMMALVKAASYEMQLLDLSQEEAVKNAVSDLLGKESIMAMRKTKSGMKECDIRPLIYELSVQDGALHCVLALEESRSCKPDMLLNAIAVAMGREVPPEVRIIRKALLGTNESDELVGVETL